MLHSIEMTQPHQIKQKTLRKTVVMRATDFPRFPCIQIFFYLNLPHHVTSKSCTPSLLKPGTQATPASSPQKITSPGWRPSWTWYPALSTVACNPVPALTLLSGYCPPEKNPLSLCGGERIFPTYENQALSSLITLRWKTRDLVENKGSKVKNTGGTIISPNYEFSSVKW